MRSRLVLLLILFLPASLPAQSEMIPIPGAALTLFTGIRAPFSSGYMVAFAADGQQVLQAYEERQGGALLGGDLELGLGGPLRLLIGASYSQTGRGDFFSARDPETGDIETFAVIYGGSSVFAKAGLSYRLQAQPTLTDARRGAATDFFVAPALVRELGSTHPAANFGVKGAFPVGTSNVEVMIGAENYLVFWRQAELRRSMGEIFDGVVGAPSVDFLYDTSNRILLRLGATLRI